MVPAHTRLTALMKFVNEASDVLDVGVSLQLRDLAFLGRNEAQALTWLSSPPVQEFLEMIANEIVSNSLDAERRAAQVKQWESTKVTHIAMASLNNISARFAREREKQNQAINDAMKRLRQCRKMRVTSPQWQNSDLRPKGRPFASPMASHVVKATAVNAEDEWTDSGVRSSCREGPADELYIEAATAELERRLTAAQHDVDRLKQCCILPVTRFQWGAWLDKNIHEFRDLMKTALKSRRHRTMRLRARPDLPTGERRLGPRRITARLSNESWALTLAGRVGWHGFKIKGDVRMFYLVRFDRQTIVIDLEPNRDRAHGQLTYKFDETFDLAKQLRPLSSLEADQPNVDGVYSFPQISASWENGCVYVNATKYKPITAPLPKKQRGDVGDDAADADDIGEDAEDDVGVGVEESDGSSQCVVDTDVDSAAARTDDSGSENSGGEVDMVIKPPLPATMESQSQSSSSSSSSSEVAKAKALTRLFAGRQSRVSLWQNDSSTCPLDNGLRIRMRRPVKKSMGGMGFDFQSKHLTPSHFGETLESCPVTTDVIVASLDALAHAPRWMGL